MADWWEGDPEEVYWAEITDPVAKAKELVEAKMAAQVLEWLFGNFIYK